MKKYLIITLILLAAVLRLANLSHYPAGLNADEASIGYNAWSLINTGKDEHGVSWPLVFRSFDDYKPAVYFYLVLPFVKVLGLNIWAVRLPSAILGTLSVYLIYLLTKKLIPQKSTIYHLPSIVALILATSPWHLQFSRGGWEVNVSTFFIIFSLLSLLYSYKSGQWLYLFSITTTLALYTYHSARLILPLIILATTIIYWKKTQALFNAQNLKNTLLAGLVGIALITPLLFQMLSKEGQSRFTGVSVFSDEGPVWEALELRRQHPLENKVIRYTHSRYLTYGLRLTKNYLSHFSPRFLFINGDEIARSKVPEVGQSLLFLAPFFFIGIFNLLKLNFRWKKFILAWFLLSPLAASLTFQSPHALRSQNMVIPLSVITGLGLSVFFNYLKSFKLKLLTVGVTLIFTTFLVYDFSRYLHMYYLHYPQELPFAWQYGFDQIATFSQQSYNKYDSIIISDRYDQPYILMAFYLHYPPEVLQKELVMTKRDKFGFSTVRKMGKFEFRQINWSEDKKLTNTLILSADEPIDDSRVIKTIFDPAGKAMYKFLESDN